MTTEQLLIQYGNKAQTKISELGAAIEEQVRMGNEALPELDQIIELIDFQEEIFGKYSSWTDTEKEYWMAFMTTRHALSTLLIVDIDEFVLPITVLSNNGGSGDFVTFPDLDAATNVLENVDAALTVRIVALENFDYGTIFPPTLLSDIATALSQSDQSIIDINALESDVSDVIANLAAHIADNVKHITGGERTAWNAKVSSTQLTDGLATKAAVSHTHPTSEVTNLDTILDGLQDQIDALPAPVDGADGVSQNIAIGTVSEGPSFLVETDITSTPETKVLNFTLVKGDQGDDFSFDAFGLLVDRTAHDGEAAGFTYLATDTGNYYIRGAGTWGDAIPFKGYDGWYYRLAVYTVDAYTEILEVVGFDGGTGPAPTIPLPPGADPLTTRFFLSSSGITTIPEYGKNIKGSEGPIGSGILTSVLVDSSPSNIDLDLDGGADVIFILSPTIAATKTFALLNAGLGRRITILFNTGIYPLVFPLNFVMDDARWDYLTKQWTPIIDVGDYTGTAIFDGTNWRLDINQSNYK